MGGTVIQVSEHGGRGFVIEADEVRYVITAAHCLPNSLTAPSDVHERTYENFLGSIGGTLNIWAECLFVDPVADIAVLGEPSVPEAFAKRAEYEALRHQNPSLCQELMPQAPPLYREFIQQPTPFALGKPLYNSDGFSIAQLLSLDGKWFSCRIRSLGLSLYIEDAEQPIPGGMSGSPIILPDGSAVGVVSESCGAASTHTTGHSPMLLNALPAWLVRAATRKERYGR